MLDSDSVETTEAKPAIVRLIAGKGRGLIAETELLPGEIICEGHVIELNPEESRKLASMLASEYLFRWQTNDDGSMRTLAIGACEITLCNHSIFPNARLIKHLDDHVIQLEATAVIAPGAEVTIRYAGPSHAYALDGGGANPGGTL